ncbi:MAG: Omp28-related outer membrane protein [Actinobacteria bacterium]|nr:Omp28-related outer membrane protein [Actinomycetota bacterium]
MHLLAHSRKILFVLFFAAIVFVFALTQAGQSQTLRNPVLEYATGTWCQYCPIGHGVIRDKILPNIPNAIIIGYHGPANDARDPMSYFEGNSILSRLDFSGYPTGIFDRVTKPKLANEWYANMSNRLSKPATVRIHILKEFDRKTRKLKAHIAFTALDILNGKFMFNAILLEDGIIHNQANYLGPTYINYVHRHVVRAMMNGALGEEVIDGTWNKDQVINKTFSYTVPAEFVADSCHIVIMVYKSGTPLNSNAEIQQAEQIPLYAPKAIITAANHSDVIADNTTPVQFQTYLHNKTLATDTYTLDPAFNGPEGWSFEYTTVNGTFFHGATDAVTIDSDDSTLITLSVNPNAIDGFGQTTIYFSSNSDPKVKGSLLLRNVTTTGVGLLQVDVDGRDAKADTLITNSLKNVYHSTLGVVSRQALQVPDVDLSHFAVIIWSAGTSSIAFSPDEVNALKTYLQAGGNLFIDGQNIGRDIFESNGASQFAQNFYHNYLHANYVADASSKKMLKGVAGDPVSSGINVIINDIYSRSPDVIAAADTNATTLLTFMSGPEVGAIRAAADDYKIVYLGFGLEQIKRNATRDTLLARAIRWMTYQEPGVAKSFRMNIDSLAFYGEVGDFFDRYAEIYNTSSSDLSLRITRTRNQFPDGWFCSLCLGELCFAPSMDTISIADYVGPLAPGDSLDFHLQVGSNGTDPGNGLVTIKIENVDDPGDSVSLTFTFLTNPTGITDRNGTMVESFDLAQNYPNPFNPVTMIRYTLPLVSGSNSVSLIIFNSAGQTVRTLVHTPQNAGQHQVTWNGKDDYGMDVPSGVYFYKLKYGEHQAIRKMILLH